MTSGYLRDMTAGTYRVARGNRGPSTVILMAFFTCTICSGFVEIVSTNVNVFPRSDQGGDENQIEFYNTRRDDRKKERKERTIGCMYLNASRQIIVARGMFAIHGLEITDTHVSRMNFK